MRTPDPVLKSNACTWWEICNCRVSHLTGIIKSNDCSVQLHDGQKIRGCFVHGACDANTFLLCYSTAPGWQPKIKCKTRPFSAQWSQTLSMASLTWTSLNIYFILQRTGGFSSWRIMQYPTYRHQLFWRRLRIKILFAVILLLCWR